MKLNSPAFQNNKRIPKNYTCDGLNVNPPLEIRDVPESANSLALIVDDPDAPRKTWNHWLLWNINPAIVFIEDNCSPPGCVQGVNDFGNNSYGGPCPPPDGEHHYHFKLYALDKILELDVNSKRQDLDAAIAGHIIEQSEWVGTYAR